MTDALRHQLTAAWIALLVVGLVRVTAIETDYREKVSAFEFRLVIEKLQGNIRDGAHVTILVRKQ